MLGTCVILREKHFLAVNNVGDNESARNGRYGFNAVGKTVFNAFLDNKTVNDYLNAVLFVFLQLYFLGKIVYYAVRADTNISRLARPFYLFCMFTLASSYNRGKKLNFCTCGKLHYPVNYLIYSLLLYFPSAYGTVRYSDSRVQKTEVIVNFRYRTNCGAWIFGCGFLVNGNCGRESLNAVNVGLFHLPEKHSRV